MIGLNKLDVVTIFKRHLHERVIEDNLIHSVAMAVGEVVEINNKRLLEELGTVKLDKRVGKL